MKYIFSIFTHIDCLCKFGTFFLDGFVFFFDIRLTMSIMPAISEILCKRKHANTHTKMEPIIFSVFPFCRESNCVCQWNTVAQTLKLNTLTITRKIMPHKEKMARWRCLASVIPRIFFNEIWYFVGILIYDHHQDLMQKIQFLRLKLCINKKKIKWDSV